MAFIRIIQPPNVNEETYDRVTAESGAVGDPPAGLLFHCAGEVDGRWQIAEAWASQADAQRFDDERLLPAIERVIGMRPPDAPGQRYDVDRVIKP